MSKWKTCALAAVFVAAAGFVYGISPKGELPADLRDAVADNPAGFDNSILGSATSNGEIPAPRAPQPVAKAATDAPDGVPVKKIGCYFNGAQPGSQAPLLIYYRGWLSGTNYPGGGLSGGKITGEANILRSSRAGLKYYKLKQLALEKGLVVLVTGSSDIPVTQADIANLQNELGYVFPRVYVAGHSGGWSGLSFSIDSLERVDRIVLLDLFYSDFGAKVLARTQNGTACGGYYTPHNKARYQKWFSGSNCAVDESLSAGDHDAWVAPSLKKNIP